MEIARKLQIKPGQTVFVQNAPEGFTLDLPEAARHVDTGDRADAVLVFVQDSSEVATHAGPFIEAARRDALAYIAYPKAGQLDTDLNRDTLWGLVTKEGVRGVRQVSLDDIWSAMRFRPA
ncbi:MAG: hypothetical protein CL878_02560 [Dehalococcoidia bacterium]|nr:hypothetical protein [Dehalococcoidia bacterium]